ncbi:MAG: YceI family protein [Saprospiraceae bacterium]|nr:YceI family protein [Saprospiraceae bacterium]
MRILRFILISLMLYAFSQVRGQTYYTKNGTIKLFSETPLEKIDPINKKAVCVMNIAKGTLGCSVLIKGFKFRNALMQTHFNENYMESGKHPKAHFKAKAIDLSQIDIEVDGKYQVPLNGILIVRGIEKPIDIEASFDIRDGKIHGSTSFVVSPADFDIQIPGIVKDKIAKEILVSVEAQYEPYEK